MADWSMPPEEPDDGEKWLKLAQAVAVLLDALMALRGGGGLR
ncbi:hypothetical protein GCM10027187_40670 [Streptosporangium sandarakinum]|uniref:Uncharacterized protein n=1 Tax=Streptosporangium sandarakinum TaxID=1260955 RepID=A0A852V4F0_9ACTN|nr:hypothetical protein [Streptosporangium sandarakinum]